MGNKLNYKLLNTLLLMAIIYIIIGTGNYWEGIVFKALKTLIPFFFAFIFAYILNSFVKKIEGKGIKRCYALILVIFSFLGLLIGLLWFIVPSIYEQLVTFSRMITEVFTDVSFKFDVNLGEYKSLIIDTLNELIRKLGSYISNGTIDVLGKSINFFTNSIIVFILGIYLLIDMDKIRKLIKKYLKPYNKQYNYLRTIDHEMGAYLHGLAISMIVQLFEYSLLFKLVGHPSWLLLGILACITTVIPYFGGLFTNVIAIVTASVISPRLFISSLIITLVFSNVDGYIISPYIYGKTNNINPVFVIFMALVCSSLFGIWGIMLGLPLYIIIRTTWNFFHQDIKDYIEDKKK